MIGIAAAARLRAAVLVVALGCAAAQDPRALVDDEALEPQRRCAAFGELQDGSRLDVERMASALGGTCEPLRATAVAILRHEWSVWPEALLQRLDTDAVAAAAVLAELALAPRPAADAWVSRMTAADRPAPLRWLALAARAAPLDRAAGELLLRALGSEHRSEAAVAVRRLPEPVADQLVGVAHALLAGGTEVELLEPFFARLSGAGSRQLLGLAATLEVAVADRVGAELARRDDPRFWERVRAAVDGEIPLEPPWLLRAGRFLDTPARRLRMAAIMADGKAPIARRVAAFDALLEARTWVPAMADFAQEGGADRWRRLFAAGLDGVPEKTVLEALGGADAVRIEAVRALQRRPPSPAEEQRLVQMARVAGQDEPADPRLQSLLLATLAQSASDGGVTVALDLAQGDPDLLIGIYDQLGKRRDPIGTAALVAELHRPEGQDAARNARLADHLALVLAEARDRRQLDRLIDGVGRRSATFVRRCRHALPVLDDAHWQTLAAALPQIDDIDVRIELLQWLGGARQPAVRALLMDAWQHAADDEVREAALLGLMAGPERQPLLAQWRSGGAIDPATADLYAFTAVATLPERLGDDDIELLQYLLFSAPRTDPREAARAVQFRSGRTGFPIVAAIADRMRRDPGSALRICAPAAALAAARDIEGLVRQRYLFLWTALQALPELRTEVAVATAALVLSIADRADAGVGPANYYLAQDLTRRGHHADAAVAARTAIAHLLRLPDDAMFARIHLGVRDGDVGSDPHAALAAAPWLASARAALANGEPLAARQALAEAREFAGRDRATLDSIAAILEGIK